MQKNFISKKNRIYFLFFLVLLTFMLCVIGINSVLPASANTVSENYSVTSFSALPSDWTLYDQSDTANTTTDFADGKMTIEHANNSTGPSQYYGGVYEIAEGRSWSDFVFELRFKHVSSYDTERWFGIMYHTQKTNGNLTGYLVNYRYKGESATSAVDSQRQFYDDGRQGTISLTDGNYHTFKIVVQGNIESHYIDNSLIQVWDISSKHAVLGDERDGGGFALIVNRSKIEIASCTIQDNSAYTLAKTYQAETNLTNPPTVVYEVTDSNSLTLLASETRKPSNAILHIDENAIVIDKNGNPLDTFSHVYTTLLKGNIIPVVRVETVAQANALIGILRQEFIYDLSVVSNDPSLVKQVKTAYKHLRGIVEFTQVDQLYDVIKTTNENLAYIAILSEDLSTAENVNYIQGRFKTVWARCNGEKTATYKAINSGAYGIVTDDFNQAYDVLEEYPENSFTRTPFNVAHRALPKQYNENSLRGTLAAVRNGATHVELDGYLTTDNQIVLIHNPTIDAMTNGTGVVESMSYAELSQYLLTHYTPNEPIPLLEEVMQALKGLDVVLVFECKSAKVELIDALKLLLDKYDFYDQIVVISFHTTILAKMQTTLPQVPTSYLSNVSNDQFTFMGEYNTGVDCPYWNLTKQANETFLRDRGIMGWIWTMDDSAHFEREYANGYIGLTNNCADYSKEKLETIQGVPASLQNVSLNDSVSLLQTNFDGTTENVVGNVFYVEETPAYFNVVASYVSDDGRVFLTQPFEIEKPIPDTPPPEEDDNTEPTLPPDEGDTDGTPPTDEGDTDTPTTEEPDSPSKNAGGCQSILPIGSTAITLAFVVYAIRKKRAVK